MTAAVPGPCQRTVPGVAGCCALVAVKRRALGKTRLAPQLHASERLALVRSMLANVLEALQGSRGVQRLLLVSPERDAVPEHVAVYPDSGRGLNAALEQAQSLILASGASELLVLPGDLPRLRAADIDALLAAGRACGCALAPDRTGFGTNALYWNAGATGGARFHFQFGAGSLRRHLAEAQRLGLEAALVQREGLELDIDTPADLRQWRSLMTRAREPRQEARR
jgi:2-phospho-L-lactate/phosphoenolpyruvate guanylyltransferase